MSNAREQENAGDDERELSTRERERLQDLIRLQPTKNSELQAAWDLESGSEVHAYLEEYLGSLYYRDEDSMIRATAEAVERVGGDPTAVTIEVTTLEADIVAVLPGPKDRACSVVATLQRLRDEGSADESTESDTVRRALRSLARKGVVEVVQRTVPTFKLARPRANLGLEVLD